MLAPVPPGRLLARLIALGQFTPEWVGEREVSIVDASRSNPVHIVVVDGEALLVVKQAGPSLDGIDPVAAETAAFRWLESRLPSGALAPRLLAAADTGLMVFEAVRGVGTLHDVVLDDSEFALLMVDDLARRLAALHLEVPDTAPVRPVPWALRLEDGPPGPIAGLDGVAHVVADLLGRPALAQAARGLRERWRASSMIHGDIKFDNVLVTGSGLGGRSWLIDWELAGGGLPEWDVAGVLEGLLAFEIEQGEWRADDLPRRLAGTARAPMRTYRGLLGERMFSAPAAMNALAVRLAQTAVQIVAMRAVGFAARSADSVPRLLECAEHVASRADELAGSLWGMEAA